MKKIYLLATAFVISITAIAQPNLNLSSSPVKGVRKAMFVPLRHHAPSVDRTSTSFYIDYPYFEDTTYGTAPSTALSSGYKEPFIYDINSNYTSLDSGTTMVVVAFDSIMDCITPGGVYYPPSSIGTLTIDSIFAQIGQQNTSGAFDTIRFNIINLTAPGFPGTTVYNTTDIVTNTSISTGGGGSWLYTSGVYTTPGYTLPFGVKDFGVQLKYYGPLQDSMGIIAGFNDGGGGCGQGSYHPLHSDFYPESFRHVSQYTTYAYIPTSASSAALDFYYDCDQSGGFTTGDAYSAFEDAGIWVYVTITSVGIQEYTNGNFTLGQNQPNPFTNSTKVNYTLKNAASNVALEIYDIRGVKMYSKSEKNQKPGNYSMEVNDFDFAAGVYFCTLNVDGEKITNRMIKQ